MTNKEQQLIDEIKQFEIEHPDETIEPLEYADYRFLQGKLWGLKEARKSILIEVEKEYDKIITEEFSSEQLLAITHFYTRIK